VTKRLRGMFFLLVVVAMLAAATGARAADFRGDEENPRVTGTVDDDVYVAGNRVVITGDVSGEVWAFGREVTLSGSTARSFLAAAEEITVSGKVGGTARTAARVVTVEGEVEGDLMAGAQEVEIGADGSVERDVLVGAEQLDVAGRIGGDLRGGVENLTITGTVAGDVDVEGDVTVEAGARIDGDLIYTSANTADIDPGATVAGRVVRREPSEAGRFDDAENLLVGLLRSVAGALILGLVLLWIVPGLLPATSRSLRSSPLASLGVGVAALVLVPLVVIFLLVLAGWIGAGFSVPLVLMASYLLVLLLSRVIVAFTIGALLLRVNRSDPRPGKGKLFFGLLVGVVILAALSLIPVAGGFIDFLVVLFAMGAAILAFFRWRKGPEPYPPDLAARAAPPAPEPTPASTTATAEP
jgi:cytoskeletal protein CcmA (bactofilin family)